MGEARLTGGSRLRRGRAAEIPETSTLINDYQNTKMCVSVNIRRICRLIRRCMY